ncbi:hypothetical protein TNCV_1629011 [Trichonephila clavipes]|uniref:Uncharacterized protein n=1 Tax=Trichonephila clavipes TaxID=2585209 RepID=A0A8X6WAD2_TRICX|nr:hypothetical protein TNCV_1629011 [Trichonephila clavipes]
MYDLSVVKRGRVVGDGLFGASVFRTVNRVGVSGTIVTRAVFTNLGLGIHEHIQRELHTANTQSRYSKTIGLGAECCEVTTVVQKPPKLNTNTIGTSQLVSLHYIILYIIYDHRTCARLVNSSRSILC